MGATTIGGALAEMRIELGLEKGQAAEKIGMSRTTYSSYEQDAQRPSIEVFPALAKFLNISVEDFLTLYGATCIAQARSSLGRVAPDHVGQNEENPSPRELTTISDAAQDFHSKAPGEPHASEIVSAELIETPDEAATEEPESEIDLELEEAAKEPPTPLKDEFESSSNEVIDAEPWSSSSKRPAFDTGEMNTVHKKKKKKKKGKKG